MKNKISIFIILIACVGIFTHTFTPHIHHKGRICLLSEHQKDCSDNKDNPNAHQTKNTNSEIDKCSLTKLTKTNNKTQSIFKIYLYPLSIPFALNFIFRSELLLSNNSKVKNYIKDKQIIISFLSTDLNILRAPPTF